MFYKLNIYLLVAVLFAVSATSAKSQEKSISASNGVTVSVTEDSFAERFEFTAPTLEWELENGDKIVAIVAAIKEPKKRVPPFITGFIAYEDDWRRYSKAIFRGGDEVNFESVSRDVLTCSSRPCTLVESFNINLTPAQIERHKKNNELVMQVRGGASSNFLISIPVDYLEAVQEFYDDKK
ncbi:hypothetical protein [Pseudidiomarina sp.]|uniref:hypothetical protein n=1 Tax=Pseudidiomarina sp. TaxID=2081707 RepID=UPI003A971513